MKEKVIQFIVIISLYIIMSILGIIGIFIMFFMNYYEWMGVVLFLICLTIASLGIYQLISKRINFKYFGGRSAGAIILSSLIFILPLFNVNNFNKTLFNSTKDGENLLDKKLALIQSESNEEKEEIVKDTFIQNSNNITDGYNVITEDNLNIYHGVGDYSESIEIIKEVISYANNNELEKYLKKFKDTEVNIVIVNDINKINSYIGSDTVAYFDQLTGNIVLQSLSKSTSINEYKGVIFHEYVHYALEVELKSQSRSITELPKWFIEGLSTYLEELYYGPEANEFNIVPSVGEITDDSNFNKGNAVNYYRYSKHLLKYMIEQGGDNFVINLLDDMKNTNDIYKSIENVLGESFEEIKINML